jgi:hypothetical protein
MKGESEIRQKLKQAQFRHLKRILRSRFSSTGDWPPSEVAEIKEEHREFFSDAPLHEIARDFPDVAALMWVLNERLDEPLVAGGTMVGAMGGVVLWADTEEDAVYAQSLIERVMDEALGSPAALVPHLEPIRKSWWNRIFG